MFTSIVQFPWTILTQRFKGFYLDTKGKEKIILAGSVGCIHFMHKILCMMLISLIKSNKSQSTNKTHRGIKCLSKSQDFKEDTSHGPNVWLEVILCTLAQFRWHVIRSSHTLQTAWRRRQSYLKTLYSVCFNNVRGKLRRYNTEIKLNKCSRIERDSLSLPLKTQSLASLQGHNLPVSWGWFLLGKYSEFWCL